MTKPFATQSNRERSGRWLNERLVNLYAHQTDGASKSPMVLYRIPGLVEWTSLGSDGPVRGQIAAPAADYMTVVVGTEVRKVSSSGSSLVLGAVLRDSNKPVSMATNGKQVAICSGGTGYIATDAQVVAIGNVPWASVSYVTYHDGYFVWVESATGKFYVSGLYDGLNVNALDFASAEKQPDNLVACVSNDTDIFLIGTDTIEPWRNTGNADFPFERLDGAVSSYGTRSPYAIVQQGGIFFIGESKQFGPRVYFMDGYTPRPVSTSFIERQIEKCARIQDAIAWGYSQEGHVFYVLQIPDSGTFVYDLSTNKWSERNSGRVGSQVVAWRPYSHSWIWNKHIVGDWSAAKLYVMDHDANRDGDREIIWEAWSTPFSSVDRPIIMDRIYIDMDTGVGESSGVGYSPFVGIEFSDDGGATWSNKRLASMGKQGVRQTRAIWWRNGRFLQRQFRVTGNYPVRTAVLGVDILAEKGTI